MAKGYHMTSKVKIPKKSGGNYIAGVRFNRNKNEYDLVLKDGQKIMKKTGLGNKAAFAGFLARKFVTGQTGITEKALATSVAFLVNNPKSEVTRSITEFL